MIELNRINSETFVAKESIVSLGGDEISLLKSLAMESPRRRARICAHRSNEDTLHEMLIAISATSYIHPHMHIGKSESFHILEGEVDVIILDERGAIMKIIKLGAQGSGRDFFYRLSEARFHTLVIHSEILVIHEVTNGPFNKLHTIMAPFAPPEEDKNAVSEYRDKLSLEVAKFKKSDNYK